MIRIGFSARPLKKELKNPRPDGLGEYRRTIEIIKACGSWGLRYYNMPPETIGWGDYSKYQPNAAEVDKSFSGLLSEIAGLSRELDISLSFHVRSSVVLTSIDKNILEKSIKEVVALRRGLELVDGLLVYVHPGYAHGDRDAAEKRLIDVLNGLPESRVAIGLETDDVGIGDLDTVLRVCGSTRGTVPVIDWGHLWGRGYRLDEAEDYLSVICLAEPYWQDRIYFHFSAVWKRKHLPLDLNFPDYRIFSEAIKTYSERSDKEIIILVESPLRENDALLVQKEIIPREEEVVQAPSVDVGSLITLEDVETGEKFDVTLTDRVPGMNEDEISIDSPVGKAIINRHEGEVVTAAVPGEELLYRIVGIKPGKAA